MLLIALFRCVCPSWFCRLKEKLNSVMDKIQTAWSSWCSNGWNCYWFHSCPLSVGMSANFLVLSASWFTWPCLQGPPGLPGFKGDPGNKGEKVSLPLGKTILLWTVRNKGAEPLNLSLTAGSCWDFRFSRSPGRPWWEGRQRSAGDRRNPRS